LLVEAGLEDAAAVVVGLDPGASDLDIRARYRAALRQHPPESDPEGFQRVRAAFEALRDPRARARTTLLRRWLVPEVGMPTAEELGAGPVVPPSVAELAADLH
jgi:curved DNA-binding protein CbpA